MYTNYLCTFPNKRLSLIQLENRGLISNLYCTVSQNYPKGKRAPGIRDIAEMRGPGGWKELDKERLARNNSRYVRSGQMGQYVRRRRGGGQNKIRKVHTIFMIVSGEEEPAEFHIRTRITRSRVQEVSPEIRFMWCDCVKCYICSVTTYWDILRNVSLDIFTET